MCFSVQLVTMFDETFNHQLAIQCKQEMMGLNTLGGNTYRTP